MEMESAMRTMHMTFYWGTEVTLLFDAWSVSSLPDYLISLVALFLLSACHEYIVSCRMAFRNLIKNNFSPSQALLNVHTPLLRHAAGLPRILVWRASETLLFGTHVGLGYLLMLAIMSFNGGVFIAILLGLISGHFIFRTDQETSEMPEASNPCLCP